MSLLGFGGLLVTFKKKELGEDCTSYSSPANC